MGDLGRTCSIVLPVADYIFEPTCAHARWALLRRLLSVFAKILEEVKGEKGQGQRSQDVKVKGQGQRSRSLLMLKRRQVGSRASSCFISIY